MRPLRARGRVMARAQKQNLALVALDCQVDTSTATGEAMASMVATFAQFERRLISQRTREALAVKKAQGVKLGRPTKMPKAVLARMRRERAKGLSYAKIANRLNEAAVPTAQGGRLWYPATVRYALAESPAKR
jgi:DNA invertase Pin-like site-specific DNA recombinase